MKLIIGLGNPGKEYNNTRHNIGFMLIDEYLSNKNVSWSPKFNGLYTNLNINNEKIYFLKPQTYMNLSGECVREFMNYFKITPEDILVIQDDLDLPLGKYRLKYNSSDGGHNGIKSIINNLKTKEFARLKIGISEAKFDTKNYVLGHFNNEEQKILNEIYPILNNILNDFQKEDIKSLMNNYNGVK